MKQTSGRRAIPVCKNCEALNKKWIEARKLRDEKEEELKSLSRKYTRALRTIDLLYENSD